MQLCELAEEAVKTESKLLIETEMRSEEANQYQKEAILIGGTPKYEKKQL